MSDIKLFRPQRLTDNPDGGGLATATPIVDGEVNNLYDDISRIDRVNGEFSLRKAFVIADTADTALYSDVHLIISAPPLDPRVSAVLFKTGVWNDDRDDAKAAVERYLDESVISRMIPYDRQLQGQRTVLVFQRKELSLPEIGEVYALKDDTTGDVEFIRVQDVDHEVQTFTDTQGDYDARVITLTISQPLSMEFAGSQPNRFFTSSASVIRKTIASDAARYKGVVVLAQDAAIGDLNIKVDTIFAQLVPSATTEVAVADAQPTGATALVAAALAPLTATMNSVWLPASNRFVTTGLLPDSIVISGVATGVDDGKGNLVATNGELVAGPVDYGRGMLTFGSAHMGTCPVTYTPAALVSKSALSYAVEVEIANRGYVYVATLRPVPAPGSTVVSFRAQGKWYTLEDDGTGALVGAIGTGTGLVNYQTGTVQVTLGALPDVGSLVIFAFGGDSEFEVRTGDVGIAPPAAQFTLASGNCEPGTFTATWLAGAVTKTATDDGAGGLTGDATGRIVYATGDVLLKPTVLPNSNAVFSLSYQAGSTTEDIFTPSVVSNNVSLALSVAPRPGSIRLTYSGTVPAVLATGYISYERTLTDDGAGHLVDSAGTLVAGSTVNYTTGAIVFDPSFSTSAPGLTRTAYENPLPDRHEVTDGAYRIQPHNGFWPQSVTLQDVTATFTSGAPMTVDYKADDATDDTITGEQIPVPAITLDLTPNVSNAIVPGGLEFVLGGKTYYERNGTLYHSLSNTTGAGTAAGTIDYASGVVSITSWTGNVAPALTINALLTQVAPLPLGVIHGRTPGSPLRPGTFYIQANRYSDGALITALADNNGRIDTSAMHGTVDSVTGSFSVGFGAYVLDSSLTSDEKAQDWYDASNVDGEGYIWRPDEVMPGTVRFNCVVQTTLPQDPEIIKINPVRLPSDGRVPVLRAGDTLVIADSLPYTMPTGLTAGQVVTLPRTGLASVALYDASGLGVAPELFTVDLVAGTVTMADPLDLTGYVEPLVAIHAIEDMALLLDAQITGDLVLGAPLSHAYSAGQALVSSALILGDAQARYEHLFAQNTFTSVWSDDLIGSAPTGGAQFNDATYPITVKNADAITQRWRLSFTSATAFDIIGETLGVIGTGTTSANVAPVNPATGLPYFTITAAGFGGGWAIGNQLRFNTVAAGAPVWVPRTVLSGPASNQDDRIRIAVRWDKD